MIEDSTKPIHVSVDGAVTENEDQVQTGGIDLVALGVSFLEQWRLAVIVTVLVGAVCVAYVYSLKPKYVASATILPQQARSSDALTNLFSSGSGVAGLYQGLLRSRTVQDLVIQRAHLLDLYHTTDMEAARGALSGTSTFESTPSGLMTVSVRDGDARNAAMIANTYLDALGDLNQDMNKQQSSRTRDFFQGQLDQERDRLTQAEDKYQALQKSTGTVDAGAQTSASLGAIQATRQNILNLQVQRSRLLESETPANPEVRALDSQIATLQAQEQQQERASGTGAPGAAPSAARVLDQSLELQRAQREVAYYTTQVSGLAADYETARLNETARSSAFQVVDRAVPPEQKDWPPRKPYLVFSLAFAVLMGLVSVMVKLLAQRTMKHAATRDRLRRLRGALR